MAARRTRERSRAARVVFVLSLVVLVGVALALAAYAFSYGQGQVAYDKVAETAFGAQRTPVTDADGDAGAGTDGSQPGSQAGSQPFTLTVDWDALAAVNPDIVGWIYLPGTAINYPVVRGADDERYLTHNFNGEVAANWLPTYGTPFLLAANAADFSDANNVVQAHNMANGSMFAKIPQLMDAAEFNAHRTVYLLTPSGDYRLTSVSMVVSGAYEPVLQTSFESQEEFRSYVQGLIDRSVVAPEPAAPAVDEVSKLFMFSTCTSDGGQYRCILVCAATEPDEPADESADAGAEEPADTGADESADAGAEEPADADPDEPADVT
ncbi:MAG: class B sortase [Coriobacteriales bacterium]|jgi:sortase B|nr:class B sortase [Coriobacteriales bacterium]